MADVKICDRCGKTIAATTAQKIGFGAWKYCLFRPDMSHKTYSDWDLCAECGEKLSKFLNGSDIAEETR